MKTNTDLVAALRMLNLEEFTATPANYRFKLAADNRVYISIKKNMFYIHPKFPHMYTDMSEMKISDKAIPHILQFIE